MRGLLAPALTDGDTFEVVDMADGAPPSLDHPLLAALIGRNQLPVSAKLGWTDVARFAAHGIPSANFGPGDATIAHMADERVERAPIAAVLRRARRPVAHRGIGAVLGRRRDRPGVDDAPRRRTGPADEEPWWDPADQAFVESPLIRGRDFPKRWRPALMPNNVEVIDPFDGVSEADAVRRARQLRRITALDEGLAYRGRDGALAVLRAEMFADPDEAAHRAAWQSDGAEGAHRHLPDPLGGA